MVHVYSLAIYHPKWNSSTTLNKGIYDCHPKWSIFTAPNKVLDVCHPKWYTFSVPNKGLDLKESIELEQNLG